MQRETSPVEGSGPSHLLPRGLTRAPWGPGMGLCCPRFSVTNVSWAVHALAPLLRAGPSHMGSPGWTEAQASCLQAQAGSALPRLLPGRAHACLMASGGPTPAFLHQLL